MTGFTAEMLLKSGAHQARFGIEMNATVTDLQQSAVEMIRTVVLRGEEIVLTDSGKPVAKIIPFPRTITVSPDEARLTGRLTDEAIIAAVREGRAETSEALEH